MEMDKVDVKPNDIKDYGTIYWKHLLKDVESSSNEVYVMCKRTSNSSVCKEMIINFQHLVYDFNNLLGHIEAKEIGSTEPQPFRTSIFSSSKEKIKIDAGLSNDVCERSTQTECEETKIGVNVMAPVFVPTTAEDGEKEDDRKEKRKEKEEEEKGEENEDEGCFNAIGDLSDDRNGSMSPYICSSPDLVGPSFSECQPWHYSPHNQSYTPFSHYHVGNNFIPSSALPYPSMSNVNLVPYPGTSIVSSIHPQTYYYNNSYPQNSFLPYQSSNVQPKSKRKGERRSGSSVKSEKSQESNLSNKVNNLSTIDESKLTNVSRESLNNIKEGIKISSVIENIQLNKNNNVSENDKNSENKLKEAPEISILGLSEAERQKQFPELKPDNRLVKKNRNIKKSSWCFGSCSKSKIEESSSSTQLETPSFSNERNLLKIEESSSSTQLETPSFSNERNLLPQTYSLVAEKNKSVDSKNLVRDCPPKVKKGINIKPETNKKNSSSVSKKQEKIEKPKVSSQSCWRDANFGKNKKAPIKILEEGGWETVRYKTRDSNNAEQSSYVPPAKDSLVSPNNKSCCKKISPPQPENRLPDKKNRTPFTLPHKLSINDIEGDILAKGETSESLGTQCESMSHQHDDFMLLTSSFLSFGDSFAIEMTPDEKTAKDEGFTEFGENSHMTINEFFHEHNAKDLYSEFMEYLSCIKWAAQVDEIRNFANLLAKDSPQSFIDSYSSPSIEHFEEFLLSNAERALEFRAEISNKYKRLKDTEEKQQQAYEKRQQLLQCKTAKVREFVQKVEEVRAAKYKLALEMKAHIDKKLKKAEENRKLHLSIIKRKAHDEEEKLKEIAFINELEAQNRRHDSLILRQEQEERIQSMLEERNKKFEEKALKKAAAEERLRLLEAERQAKLQEISEKRKKKEENIDLKQQVRKKEREEIAREKKREREERILARQAAQIANVEELQRRIQFKQEETARRHEESIELIRQKALEIGLHKTNEDTLALTCCKTEDQKEVDTHHYSYNELMPAFKKKCKKIRSRMVTRGIEYCQTLKFDRPVDHMKMSHELQELNKLVNSSNFNDKTSCLINSRLSTIRDIVKQEEKSISSFINGKGFLICSAFLKRVSAPTDDETYSSRLPLVFMKPLQILTVLYCKLFTGTDECFKYLLFSNDLLLLLDLLELCFSQLKQQKKREEWLNLGENLCCIITLTFNYISEHMETDQIEESKIVQDSVSYVICSGIVNSITDKLRMVVIEGFDYVTPIIAPSIIMFSSLICKKFYCADLKKLLNKTDCLETVYLLCESLQKIANGSKMPDFVISIIKMLIKFAMVDITSFQSTLGAEGVSLQIRSIASTVITFCTKNADLDHLLVAMIQLIGYFSIRNEKNQAVLQSGQQPTVLQLLVTLPFQYFCKDEYKLNLFATLLACSFENPINTAVVESELSYDTLESFASSCTPGRSALLDIFYRRTDESKAKKKKSKKSKRKQTPEESNIPNEPEKEVFSDLKETDGSSNESLNKIEKSESNDVKNGKNVSSDELCEYSETIENASEKNPCDETAKDVRFIENVSENNPCDETSKDHSVENASEKNPCDETSKDCS